MGRPFTRAGRAGWPYLETEALDLRSAESIQDSRDILRILKTQENFHRILNRGIFVGDNNENLKKDLNWRAQYVGQSLDFCELAAADLSWLLSEGSYMNMNGSSKGVRNTTLKSTTLSLSRHGFFKDAYIARNPFRAFHRNDGMFLSQILEKKC
jgi:hypothetical protein